MRTKGNYWKQSFKSLVAFCALAMAITAACAWFGFSRHISGTVWLVRVGSTLLFALLVWYLFWLEFLRDKRVSDEIDTMTNIEIHQAVQTPEIIPYLDEETYRKAKTLLDETHSIKSLFTYFGSRKGAYQFYAVCAMRTALGMIQKKTSGAYYRITWFKRYNDRGSMTRNLINLVTIPLLGAIAFSRIVKITTIHRLDPEFVRKFKVKQLFWKLLEAAINISILVLVVVGIWQFGKSIMEEAFWRQSTLAGSACVLSIGTLFYICNQIYKWPLNAEFTEIAKGHFRFDSIVRVANDLPVEICED